MGQPTGGGTDGRQIPLWFDEEVRPTMVQRALPQLSVWPLLRPLHAVSGLSRDLAPASLAQAGMHQSHTGRQQVFSPGAGEGTLQEEPSVIGQVPFCKLVLV